jgi:hypothetical protein
VLLDTSLLFTNPATTRVFRSEHSEDLSHDERSSSRDWNPSKESGTGREHPRYLARLARCFADANHAGDKETRRLHQFAIEPLLYGTAASGRIRRRRHYSAKI